MLREAELGTLYPPPWSEGTAGTRISDAKSSTWSYETETNSPEEVRTAKRNTTRPISRNGRELSAGQQIGAAAREREVRELSCLPLPVLAEEGCNAVQSDRRP